MFSKSFKKNKQIKNKTKKQKYNLLGGSNNIWDNYGHVLNTKTNKYIRLGSNESMRVINELEHNNEWKKRVKYIIENHGVFGKKLEKYLEKKIKIISLL
jgi:hypothetical protein